MGLTCRLARGRQAPRVRAEQSWPQRPATPWRQAEPATYICRTLRAGTVEEHLGAITILGDVKRGAAVISGSDIVVFGRLQGEAHAGCRGDRRATISAVELTPTQLRIADVASYAPRNAGSPGHPETAAVDNSTLQIQLRPSGGAGTRSPPAPLLSAKQHAARAALLTGAYIMAVGLALLLAPQTIFGMLFDTRAVTPGWIRVGGVLCTLFGSYYLGPGWAEMRGQDAAIGFYTATVLGRISLCVAFCLLVLTGQVEAMLLVPAVVNLLSAVNMQLALRRRTAALQ